MNSPIYLLLLSGLGGMALLLFGMHFFITKGKGLRVIGMLAIFIGALVAVSSLVVASGRETNKTAASHEAHKQVAQDVPLER